MSISACQAELKGVAPVRETFFRHLQPMDDTAMGILRSPCGRAWREVRRGLRAKPWQTLRGGIEEKDLVKGIPKMQGWNKRQAKNMVVTGAMRRREGRKSWMS